MLDLTLLLYSDALKGRLGETPKLLHHVSITDPQTPAPHVGHRAATSRNAQLRLIPFGTLTPNGFPLGHRMPHYDYGSGLRGERLLGTPPLTLSPGRAARVSCGRAARPPPLAAQRLSEEQQ